MKLPQQRRVRRTTILTVGLLAFVGGLGFAKLRVPMASWWFLPAIVYALLSLKHRWLMAIVAAMLCGFLVGWWRGAQVQQRLEPYDMVYNTKVVLIATASSDAVYADHSQLSFDATNIQFIKPVAVVVPGTVTVKGFGENVVFRGDRLQIEGKLQTTLGGKQGRMSFADVHLVQHHDSLIDNIRRRFNAGLISSVPEPMASFGLGLLIGQRNTLPADITKQLSVVGLSHIVAVSGYNLTIIVDSVRRLVHKRSKYQSAGLSLLLIGGFLLVTGLSASIVRAAIVSVLGLWAWYYGRKFEPLLLLALAAAITGGWSPLYVWGDIGWYLSFVAFFGVLVVSPLIVKRLYKPNHPPHNLTMVLIESFSAQLLTAPIILFVFQQASLVALPSNALIVPLVPLGMLLAFVAGLGGMVAGTIAGWFAWPARIILTYMLDAISLLSRIPHAAISRSLSLAYLLLLYVVILLFSLILWHKTRGKDAIIYDVETPAAIDSS